MEKISSTAKVSNWEVLKRVSAIHSVSSAQLDRWLGYLFSGVMCCCEREEWLENKIEEESDYWCEQCMWRNELWAKKKIAEARPMPLDVIETRVVTVVIAQQLFSYRQLSRLRKSATAAALSHRSCTVSCVGWLWQLNRCSTECGATPHSGQTSDMLLVIRAL